MTKHNSPPKFPHYNFCYKNQICYTNKIMPLLDLPFQYQQRINTLVLKYSFVKP